MSACTFILLFTREHGTGMECFICPPGHIEQGKTVNKWSEIELVMRGRTYAPGDTSFFTNTVSNHQSVVS